MSTLIKKIKCFSIVRRWHWRLDFLWRESVSRSKRLQGVVMALAQIESTDSSNLPILFLDGEAETRFLFGVMKLRLLKEIRFCKINCVSDIYLTKSTFVNEERIYITGSLFAKFHIVWLDVYEREKMIII